MCLLEAHVMQMYMNYYIGYMYYIYDYIILQLKINIVDC